MESPPKQEKRNIIKKMMNNYDLLEFDLIYFNYIINFF